MRPLDKVQAGNIGFSKATTGQSQDFTEIVGLFLTFFGQKEGIFVFTNTSFGQYQY